MIIALHGFLGLPSDWTHFDGAFRASDNRELTIRKWNLYGDIPAQPPATDARPLRIWARDFCQRIHDGWKVHGSEGRTKPMLLGYSMGGRLALHALLEAPELFSGAVIVGAHPGLAAGDLRMQRRLNDAKWAERFRTEDWTSLVRAWGEQDVFKFGDRGGDAIDLQRQEIDFDRVSLARAMRLWSLAEQENLRPFLADVRVPVLWLNGESDGRFRDLYRELRLDLVDTPAHAFDEVPQAGHRVPWDNPVQFTSVVQN